MRLLILLMKYKTLNNDEWLGEKRFFNNPIISLNGLFLSVIQVDGDLVWAGFKSPIIKTRKTIFVSFMLVYFFFFKAKSSLAANKIQETERMMLDAFLCLSCHFQSLVNVQAMTCPICLRGRLERYLCYLLLFNFLFQ